MSLSAIIEITKIVVALLILFGAILSLISGFGVVRLPDIYTRSHATTKSAALGVLTILVGTFLYLLVIHGHISIKVILGIFFVFWTTPTAGHLVARAAYRTNVGVVTDPYDENAKKITPENGPKF